MGRAARAVALAVLDAACAAADADSATAAAHPESVRYCSTPASAGTRMSAAADTDDPKLSAARVSAVAIIGYVAFLVGPPVLGLLGHQFGILHALLLVLVLVVLAGLFSPAAREHARRAPAAASPIAAP